MNKPRPTRIHQKRHAIIGGALKRLGKLPEYGLLIRSGAVALLQQDSAVARAVAEALVDLVCAREPEFARLLGRDAVIKLLAVMISTQAGVILHPAVSLDAAAEVVGRATDALGVTERISPDNDKVAALRGSLLVKERAGTEELLEGRDYQRSLQEPRRKTGGRARIDLHEAVEVRAMKMAGKKGHEIARRFWPQRNPYGADVRKLISRRIEHANLHSPL